MALSTEVEQAYQDNKVRKPDYQEKKDKIQRNLTLLNSNVEQQADAWEQLCESVPGEVSDDTKEEYSRRFEQAQEDIDVLEEVADEFLDRTMTYDWERDQLSSEKRQRNNETQEYAQKLITDARMVREKLAFRTSDETLVDEAIGALASETEGFPDPENQGKYSEEKYDMTSSAASIAQDNIVPEIMKETAESNLEGFEHEKTKSGYELIDDLREQKGIEVEQELPEEAYGV